MPAHHQASRPRRTPPGHICPVRGCKRTVPNHYLMCGGHWYMVPASLQRRVNAAYAEAKAAGFTGQGLGPPALTAAQIDAIEAVNAKLAA